MSIFSFLKDVGEKLFTPKQASASQGSAASGPASTSPSAGGQQAQDVANGDAIQKYIVSLGLNVSNLKVTYDSASYTATISGAAPNDEMREKVVLAAGNVMNVAKVDDQMTVTAGGGATAKFHTVEKGDTLSKIAKQVYGDANKYNKIFQANQPMLKSADLIYPGQVLRIPD